MFEPCLCTKNLMTIAVAFNLTVNMTDSVDNRALNQLLQEPSLQHLETLVSTTRMTMERSWGAKLESSHVTNFALPPPCLFSSRSHQCAHTLSRCSTSAAGFFLGPRCKYLLLVLIKHVKIQFQTTHCLKTYQNVHLSVG
jgi:hypothetical protein